MQREQALEVAGPAIDRVLAAQPRAVLAIDGRAASGKTTFAALLAQRYNAAVIAMDHFFLPADLRTDERYTQPGGAIHWERFLNEIAPNFCALRHFSYRVFDCMAMDYMRRVAIPPAALVIVEGSYATHPYTAGLYDLRLFLTCDKITQHKRVLRRNGTAGAEAFYSRWIPLEEQYFAQCNIPNSTHIVLETDNWREE